ncbi:MAG: DUF2156 domain-containing protein [Ruminococcus sp.]|nr:DUF2156 domain-containing protein [Ruminococcus sp.]
MLEFHELTLNDLEWARAALRASDFMGCEYSFANNLAWRRLYHTTVAFYNGFFINKAEIGGVPHFTYPAGEGDTDSMLRALMDYANGQGYPLILTGVTKPLLTQIQSLFPDTFDVLHTEDSDDYIYHASDLASLGGRAYHQKRNHLHRFEKYGGIYAPLEEKDFDDCITLSAVTYNTKNGQSDESSRVEQFVIHTLFSHFHALGLNGGTIRVDGQLVAFCIGEQINSNTLNVHIEKADTSFDGSFAAINNMYAKHAAGDLPYINREEDMGLEGLRKAKRSYRPAFMLEKHMLTQRGFAAAKQED